MSFALGVVISNMSFLGFKGVGFRVWGLISVYVACIMVCVQDRGLGFWVLGLIREQGC